MQKQNIIILGTGGNSIDILDAIAAVNQHRPAYHPLGFLDDDPGKTGLSIFGKPVLGPLHMAGTFKDALFVNGIGNQKNFWKKKEIIERTGLPPSRFESIIHPSAIISAMAEIGRGVVIFQNATVCANAVIGDHVIILPNSVISHDCIIGSYSSVAGGVVINGGCRIGDAAYIGARAAIREHIHVGEKSLVGMGAVVTKDVPENTVVAGCPARVMRGESEVQP